MSINVILLDTGTGVVAPARPPARQTQWLTADWSWQLEARCSGEDPTVFFSPDGEGGTARLHRQSIAKAICAECVAASEGRNHAFRLREAFGVWDGLGEGERRGNERTHRSRASSAEGQTHCGGRELDGVGDSYSRSKHLPDTLELNGPANGD